MKLHRRSLEPSHMNRHALAFIQSLATITLACFAVIVLGWLGGF